MDLLIERISALRRNVLKTFATSADLQLVHVEILQYLAICNQYSDTARAISRYLGQTKGTVSQSLHVLEARRLVRRHKDPKDKRIFHLKLTAKGKQAHDRLSNRLRIERNSMPHRIADFEELLRQLQYQNGFKGFGICTHCKFNRKVDERSFYCELTKEKLAIDQSMKICGEYET